MANFLFKSVKIRHILIGQIPPATTPLYHGQQLCKVLSQSKIPVNDYMYGPESNFRYL